MNGLQSPILQMQELVEDGSCSGGGSVDHASKRGYVNPDYSNSDYSFRILLYVNI